MLLKQASRSAIVAFAPNAPLIASGTMAGAIDMSFSSSACVEISKLDLSSESREMPVIGSVAAAERFYQLCWGMAGAETQEYPYGILAGGLQDGTVYLWNPAKLVSGRQADIEESQVANLQKHRGAVRGLEFNPYSANLLASGAEDGQICIWDMINPKSPSLYPALRGGSPLGEIAGLAWNKRVQHILASTSLSGSTVVWDLRRQKQVISFSEPGQHRSSALQWDPDVPTQVIVASDDDRSPALQVWDLRNAMQPFKQLSSHSKGVLALSWSPFDSGLLLSSAKDNRTLLWDTSVGEVLQDLPSGSNWNFDVRWSPAVPGVFSTSCFDGKISILNIESSSPQTGSDIDFSAAISRQAPAAMARAPKWLRRTGGASFAFGGRLLSFRPAPSPGPGHGQSQVRLHQVVTEEALVGEVKSFEGSLAKKDKSTLRQLCDDKTRGVTDEDEREIWMFLKLLFEDEPRPKLLNHLGYGQIPPPSLSAPLPAAADEPETLTDAADSAVADVLPSGEALPSVATAGPALGDGSSFFETLEGPATPKGDVGGDDLTSAAKGVPGEADSAAAAQNNVPAVASSTATAQEEVEEEEEDGDLTTSAVQVALVGGDYGAAVELCMTAGRAADALVLASVGGQDLWEATQAAYLKKSRSPYMQILDAVLSGNLQGLVRRRPLASWRETLALLCSYAREDNFSSLCAALAARLELGGNPQAAVLCYIFGGSLEPAVTIWCAEATGGSEPKLSVKALQAVMEKVVVLSAAIQQRAAGLRLASLVSDLCEVLAGQGCFGAALEYLSLLPPGDAAPPAVKILRDRVYRSAEPQVAAAYEVPPFPFQEEVASAAAQITAQAAQGGYAAAQPAQQPSSYAMQQLQSVYGTQVAPSQPQAAYVPQPPAYQPTPAQPQAAYVPQTPAYQQTPAQPPASYVPQPTGYQPVSAQQAMYGGQMSYAQQPQVPLVPQRAPAVAHVRPHLEPSTPSRATPPPSLHSYAAEYAPSAADVAARSAPLIPKPAAQQVPPSFMQPTPPTPFVPQQAASLSLPAGYPGGDLASPPPKPFVPSAPPPVQFNPVTTPAMAVPPLQPTPAARPLPLGPVLPVATPEAPSAAVPAPAPPPAPPATVQTADVSNVPAELKPAVAALTGLFTKTAEAAARSGQPARKREADDNSRRLGALFVKLNARDFSPPVAQGLVNIGRALDAGDFAAALQIQVALTTQNWDECSTWLTALKRMIKLRQTL